MGGTDFLREAVLLFGIAIGAAWAFRRLRAPTILGFLFAGLVIGPSSLRLIPEENVGRFAELGLVLLLFTIGIELSPATLFRAGPRLVAACAMQVGAVAAATALALHFFGADTMTAWLVGAGASLSSTAIALKQLSDRGEAGGSVGLVTTAMLLLQDGFVVLLIAALPLLGSAQEETSGAHLLGLLSAFGILVIAIPAARWLLPPMLAQVVAYGGRELLALFAVFMACGGAYVAESIGWPLSLGACIAGLLLASAPLRHQLVAEIAPFRDVFNALFFISLGMLVNVEAVLAHLPLLALAIVATLAIKTLLTAVPLLLTRWPFRVSLQVGICLCTVSEFGYALVHEAYRFGLMGQDHLALFTAYIVGTMMAGAVLFPAARPLAHAVARVFDRVSAPEPESADAPVHALSGHVILAGYGDNGETLARVLRATHVPFCIVEMNPDLVRRALREGMQVVAGDATRSAILEHAGLGKARALVVAVNDPEATRRVVAQARARRADLYIIARTRAVEEIDRLEQLGASLVVSTNFEGAIEIFARVLREFGVPGNIVEAQIASARAKGYGLLRGEQGGRIAYMDALLKVLQTTVIQSFFLAETSPAANQSIAGFNLRARSGVTIIAVVRDGKPTTNPPADFIMRPGDVLVLVGAHAQLDDARNLLEVDAVAEEQAPGDGQP